MSHELEIEKGRPARTALSSFKIVNPRLRSHDILGLQSLGAALDLELHLRTFLQSAISAHLDCTEVYKHVIAVGALDKTVALGGVKPFHNTFFSHY